MTDPDDTRLSAVDWLLLLLLATIAIMLAISVCAWLTPWMGAH